MDIYIWYLLAKIEIERKRQTVWKTVSGVYKLEEEILNIYLTYCVNLPVGQRVLGLHNL